MTDEAKTGGCLCGQFRYETSGDPAQTMVCHCKVCQKTSGSALSTIALYQRNQLTTIQGALKAYTYKSDQGTDLTINFCPDCGSPVLLDIGTMPDLVSVKVGSYDDTSWFKPAVNIWTDSRQPWFELDPDAVNVPKQ